MKAEGIDFSLYTNESKPTKGRAQSMLFERSIEPKTRAKETTILRKVKI
jgi:hypothetical protein